MAIDTVVKVHEVITCGIKTRYLSSWVYHHTFGEKERKKYQIRTLFDREIPRTTNTERIPNFQGPGLIVSSSPPCVCPGEPFPTELSARVVGLFLCGTNYWFRQSWKRRETPANFNSIQHLVPFWKNTISIQL